MGLPADLSSEAIAQGEALAQVGLPADLSSEAIAQGEALAQVDLPTQDLPFQESGSDRSGTEVTGLLIPLDIQTTEAGLFELTWELPPTSAFNGSYWLRDNHSGQVVGLTGGGSYRFEVNDVAGKRPDRFTFTEASPTTIMHRSSVGKPVRSEPRFELLITAPDVDGLTELGVFPEDFVLNQNYPNPFNPSTIISYEVPLQSDVRLDVYDMTGRRVATLVDGQIPAGRHTVTFDAGHLSSGIYIYRLQAGNTVRTRKLTLIK